MWVRTRSKGPGAANGEDDSRPPSGADPAPRLRRAGRRDLPRARVAAAAGSVMIARLRGRPVGRRTDGLVLDVGGVGYLVQATPTALRSAADGEEVTLETYLHVREDT